MNGSLQFTSTLEATRREELAELMFLNIRQHRVRSGIVNSIDKYGLPEIVEVDNKLRFTVDKLSDVQTLRDPEGSRENEPGLRFVMFIQAIMEESVPSKLRKGQI